METKTDPKIWAIVTIAVAIIGCLGVLGSAFVGILPDLIRPTSTPVAIPPVSTINTKIPQATEVNTPSNTPENSKGSVLVECVHPDQLAAEYGWKNSRIIDKYYGGYNVYVPNPSQLPPYWDANYFGLDNKFTSSISRNATNRQMDIGTWIIYAPDECRSKWGFHTSSAPAPTTIASSDIPSTVLCIHPENLISQKGWSNLGILDKSDGGFKARISASDSLPEYWEANMLDDNGNLIRQILYFDPDRRMDAGVWVIYTPPVKSCRDEFGFKIGGK